MDNQYDGAIDRRWSVIFEIDDFIILNCDNDILETKTKYCNNYLRHLERLYFNKQIIIQRNEYGKIIGVCGWIIINKEDEVFINKITWALPTNICKGDIMHISFCVINGGNIHQIRKQLKERYGNIVKEVTWYNLKCNQFFRKTLKEK